MACRTLPEDLMVRILVRLPVKSLVRFGCVHKSWESLIRSRSFISAHLRRRYSSPPPPVLLLKLVLQGPNRYPSLSFLSTQTLLSSAYDADVDLSLPAFADDPNMEILGPSHGVLCLSGGWDNIVLWNPATRRTHHVPPSTVPRSADRDPLTAGVGFGFDPKTRQFKVVRVVALYDESGMDCDYMAEVYYPASASWKEVPGQVHGFVRASPRAHAYCSNGVYHWLAAGDGAGYLVSFDFADEVFRSTPMPDYPDYLATEICRNYVEVDGHGAALNVAVYPYDENSSTVDIWVLNEEEGAEWSWTKRVSFGPLSAIDTPLGFWKDAEFLLETRSGELISYNLNTMESRNFQVQGEARKLQLLPYVESLVSIDANDLPIDQDHLNIE